MTDRLRAREIREMLRGRVDPKVSYCLEQLAEQQSVYEQQLLEMAQALDQCINIVSDFSQIAINMKSAVDTIRKRDLPEGISIGSEPIDD